MKMKKYLKSIKECLENSDDPDYEFEQICMSIFKDVYNVEPTLYDSEDMIKLNVIKKVMNHFLNKN